MLKKSVSPPPSALLTAAAQNVTPSTCDASSSLISAGASVASGAPSLSASTPNPAPVTTAGLSASPSTSQQQTNQSSRNTQATNAATVGLGALGKPGVLTVKDIERDAGKPLTKYERNMMIFTWLQTLQEAAPVTSASLASVAGLDVQQL